ncbi:sensor histidine kinase [Deinococcus sp. YIM 134068]|uniref:sensor histidine kinase n=1 Tax=Deinococcus lichenicola TaxID=3118910 RepID=UPI002F94DC83
MVPTARRPGTSSLAREVALPHTPRWLRIQSRVFLSIAAAFLLFAVPLALLASASLRGAIHRTYSDRALRESGLIATLPPVRAALGGDAEARAGLNRLMNEHRLLLGADYVVVTDLSTRRLTHPEPDRIGEPMVGGDFTSFRAGRPVTETVRGTLGPSVRAKVPVLDGQGRVLGLVSVGFLLPRLGEVFEEVVRVALPWYVGALALALGGASVLARRVRREMLDLEPEQIAGGLLHFRTVLGALEEGVLVVRGGQVYLMNAQARALLGVGAEELPVALDTLLPGGATTLLGADTSDAPVPLTVRGRPLLVGVRPAPDGAGVVVVRDLARVRALADELTQSRRYADLLRAQTHEFTNRLHTLAGLLHLGETREALALIYAQSRREAEHIGAVRALRPVRLAALVLGKYERAAERGVTLTLDPHSALPDGLPAPALDLIELAVGNFLENAFEALEGHPAGEVRLLVAGDPEGLVVEVRDNGPGVPAPLAGALTERGVSSKGAGRGVGLSLVRGRANALGATLTHDRVTDPDGRSWTRFTLDLPAPGVAA